MTEERKCRDCDTVLTVGQNTLESYVTKHKGICIPCKRKSNKLYKPLQVAKNPERMYVNGKYISKKHPLYKAGIYRTFNDAAFTGFENYESTKEGYIYAISNPAWEGWLKLGMAIDPNDRCSSYQTSSPLRDYVLIHSRFFKDRRKAESKMHILAEKIAENFNSEWFELSKENAITIIDSIEDESSSDISSMVKRIIISREEIHI